MPCGSSTWLESRPGQPGKGGATQMHARSQSAVTVLKEDAFGDAYVCLAFAQQLLL